MAAIQGPDKYFNPSINQVNRSGEYLAVGLQNLGAGLGQGVQMAREEKQKKDQQKAFAQMMVQNPIVRASLPAGTTNQELVKELSKQDPEAQQLMVKTFLDGQAQIQEGIDAFRARKAEKRQQEFDNDLAINKFKLQKKEKRQENRRNRKEDRRERNKLTGPAKDLQDLYKLRDQYAADGKTEEVASTEAAITEKSNGGQALPEKAVMLNWFKSKGMAQRIAELEGIHVDDAAIKLYKNISSRPLTPMEEIMLSGMNGQSSSAQQPAANRVPTADDAMDRLFQD